MANWPSQLVASGQFNLLFANFTKLKWFGLYFYCKRGMIQVWRQPFFGHCWPPLPPKIQCWLAPSGGRCGMAFILPVNIDHLGGGGFGIQKQTVHATVSKLGNWQNKCDPRYCGTWFSTRLVRAGWPKNASTTTTAASTPREGVGVLSLVCALKWP